MIDTTIFFVVALVASALGGMLGMAGGIFVVPVLTIFLGVPIRIAIGASLVSVIACSCASAAPYLRAGLTNLRLAVVLETATALGAVTGVLLTGAVPLPVLFALFAAILLISAYQMRARRVDVVALPTTGRDPLRLAGRFRDPSGREVTYHVHRLPLGLGLMYGAGLISALLGIGSGVLKIPAMDGALRLPIKVSSATSNLMIGVTACASTGVYFLRGDIVEAVAGPIALGSVLGALLGARVLMAISSERIRLVFVLVLVALAGFMVLGAAGIDVVRGAG
ncbi:MAG TPA: sulfite exporter TauE/SafE family protein [Kofleriaceae bacterium]|nr:sulfite exporter TauE/SafE family protein [Kofleriaceae bacterium]